MLASFWKVLFLYSHSLLILELIVMLVKVTWYGQVCCTGKLHLTCRSTLLLNVQAHKLYHSAPSKRVASYIQHAYESSAYCHYHVEEKNMHQLRLPSEWIFCACLPRVYIRFLWVDWFPPSSQKNTTGRWFGYSKGVNDCLHGALQQTGVPFKVCP